MSDKSLRGTFIWNSQADGKPQYPRFEAEFNQRLSATIYILDPTLVDLAMLPDPGLQPNAVAARREWRKDVIKYKENMLKINKDHLEAMGHLRDMFPYGTGARSLVERIINSRPAAIAVADWGPISQFPRILQALKTEYAPADHADTAAMRAALQILNDQGPGGYVQYRTDFCRGVNELIATRVQGVFTQTELREWVKVSLRNEKVMAYMAAWYFDHPDCTYLEMFEYADQYINLLTRAGSDPYKSVASVSGKATAGTVSANTASVERDHIRNAPRGNTSFVKKCTRCWRSGHDWKNCTAKSCVACNRPLAEGDKTCASWKTHASSNHKFTGPYEPWNRPIPSHKRPAESDRTFEPASKVSATGEMSDKDIKKAYRKIMAVSRRSKRDSSG
jgi:hypothetical protein